MRIDGIRMLPGLVKLFTPERTKQRKIDALQPVQFKVRGGSPLQGSGQLTPRAEPASRTHAEAHTQSPLAANERRCDARTLLHRRALLWFATRRSKFARLKASCSSAQQSPRCPSPHPYCTITMMVAVPRKTSTRRQTTAQSIKQSEASTSIASWWSASPHVGRTRAARPNLGL